VLRQTAGGAPRSQRPDADLRAKRQRRSARQIRVRVALAVIADVRDAVDASGQR